MAGGRIGSFASRVCVSACVACKCAPESFRDVSAEFQNILCGGKKIKNIGTARVSAYSLSSCNMVCMLVTCQNGLSLVLCLNFGRSVVFGRVVLPLAITNIYTKLPPFNQLKNISNYQPNKTKKLFNIPIKNSFLVLDSWFLILPFQLFHRHPCHQPHSRFKR